MKKIKFTKMAASGNDFIVLDKAGKDMSRFVQDICRRKFSIGGDGVLLIEPSNKAHFKMRIFNPDGSEVAMCGNGSRCAALYAFRKKKAPKKQKIETRAGILEAEVKGEEVELRRLTAAASLPTGFRGAEPRTVTPIGGTGAWVRIKMTEPKGLRLNFSLTIGENVLKANFVNTGVPHVVYFVDNIEAVDVIGRGRSTRYHSEFAPEGANADFVKVMGGGSIQIRTYERGVEDETLACGTGAVASSIIAAKLGYVQPPVDVHTAGGGVLRIYFSKELRDVYLEGDAKIVYEGVLDYV